VVLPSFCLSFLPTRSVLLPLHRHSLPSFLLLFLLSSLSLQVCNHPDIFAGRAIVSPLDLQPLTLELPSLITPPQVLTKCWIGHPSHRELPSTSTAWLNSGLDLSLHNLLFLSQDCGGQRGESCWAQERCEELEAPRAFLQAVLARRQTANSALGSVGGRGGAGGSRGSGERESDGVPELLSPYWQETRRVRQEWAEARRERLWRLNHLRCFSPTSKSGRVRAGFRAIPGSREDALAVIGGGVHALSRASGRRANSLPPLRYGSSYQDLQSTLLGSVRTAPNTPLSVQSIWCDEVSGPRRLGVFAESLREAVRLPWRRYDDATPLVENFVCLTPKARAPPVEVLTRDPAWESQMVLRGERLVGERACEGKAGGGSVWW